MLGAKNLVMEKSQIKRRKFINQTSQMAACSLLLSSGIGCGSVDEEPSRITTDQAEPVTSNETSLPKSTDPKDNKPKDIEPEPKLSVKIGGDLKKIGGSQSIKDPVILDKLEIKEPKDRILLIRKDENTITATNLLCTHNGCVVAYNKKQKSLDCPCHGGRFNLDGSVKNGPPKVPLKTVVTEIKDDRVIFLGEAKR